MCRKIPLLCLSALSVFALAAISIPPKFVEGQSPSAGKQAASKSTEPAITFEQPAEDRTPSPYDLVVDDQAGWLVAVCQRSNTAALVDLKSNKLLATLPIGAQPTSIAQIGKAARVAIACSHAGTLELLSIVASKEGKSLRTDATIALGDEPTGVAISPDGKTAYASLATADCVAVVDLVSQKITQKIDVGRWPRSIALSADGARLAVVLAGEPGFALVDLKQGTLAFKEKFPSINPGQVVVSPDGKHAWFPRLYYGANPPRPAFIRLGWVLASRLQRVTLDIPKEEATPPGVASPGAETKRVEAERHVLSLDPIANAIADPHGLAMTPDGKQFALTAAGTHEMVVLATEKMPLLRGTGGSDHADPSMVADDDRFFRITLGGRPLGVRISSDSRTAYVANYLSSEVQIVDLVDRQVRAAVSVASAEERERAPSLVRQGEEIFHDADRSFEHWYSCQSCHFNGGSNVETIDTFNDDTEFTFKTVLPLYQLAQTGPWTWHGLQDVERDSIAASMESTMQGNSPSREAINAVAAYFASLTPPPNPHRGEANSVGLDAATVARGKAIFNGDKAMCSRCHSGDYFTDGELHDVGLGSKEDAGKLYNTPTLLGVYRKARLFHSGKAHTLEEALTKHHSPAQVSGTEALTDAELADLVAYLKTL